MQGRDSKEWHRGLTAAATRSNSLSQDTWVFGAVPKILYPEYQGMLCTFLTISEAPTSSPTNIDIKTKALPDEPGSWFDCIQAIEALCTIFLFKSMEVKASPSFAQWGTSPQRGLLYGKVGSRASSQLQATVLPST